MDPASMRRHTPSEQDDGTLVHSVLAGDNAAFATIYDRYGDALFAFSTTMLGDRENAADVVQEVFVTAAERRLVPARPVRRVGGPCVGQPAVGSTWASGPGQNTDSLPSAQRTR